MSEIKQIQHSGAVITREALLRFLRPLREFRRSHTAIVEAHDATKDEGPDHAIRLRAAELNLKLLDAFPKPADDLSAGRPINVAIVLSAQPAPPLPGVTVALDSDNGIYVNRPGQ